MSEEKKEKSLKKKGSRTNRLREKRDRRAGFVLTLFFSIIVFIVLVITMVITIGVLSLLYSRGILRFSSGIGGNITIPFAFLGIVSIFVGTIVSFVIGSIPLRPFQNMVEGLRRLSEGDYGTRLEVTRPALPLNRDIVASFNTLAYELEHTEMFRSDFINNFSHEFKTPIVSIEGFARLLKRGNLTEEQEKEYLDIIEEESERLSTMATKVLDLTKVEDQAILTDVTGFDLSEQIRDCVLLLEKQWSAKNLTPSLGFNEYVINANEELLKQVWINLLDNTIKYSPEGSSFEISILANEDETLTVKFKNFGPKIPEDDLPLIMNKFYQGDTSHASEGNGIGRAIVKRVVDLHGGSVKIDSREGETVFSVNLPEYQ